MKIIHEPAYTFDDVILVPRYSSIKSRFNGEIDCSVNLVPGVTLQYPIISANMDTVTGCTLAQTMQDLGGLGIIHHYLSVDKHIEALRGCDGPRVACVGVGSSELYRAGELSRLGLADAFLIDTAHGDSEALHNMVITCRSHGPGGWPIPIIAGNVATYEAAYKLFQLGVQCIKVGVGPGSLCLTRVKTGNGYPQLSAITEVARARNDFAKLRSTIWHNPQWTGTIIADGGIRDGGDCVKALAAGADAVMIGNLFAGTKESLAILGHHPTTNYCTYRGMASLSFKQDQNFSHTRGVEGDVMSMPRKGSAVGVFTELVDGILSGMSYQGAHNIKELQDNAVFRVQTVAGTIEGTAHGLNRC